MIFLSFLFVGLVCLIGQIILDNTNFTSGHLTTLFVVIGTFLDIFNIYDKFVLMFGRGALVPITSFGHLLVHGALVGYRVDGFIGILTGMFSKIGAGIAWVIILSFILSFVFKPKD